MPTTLEWLFCHYCYYCYFRSWQTLTNAAASHLIIPIVEKGGASLWRAERGPAHCRSSSGDEGVGWGLSPGWPCTARPPRRAAAASGLVNEGHTPGQVQAAGSPVGAGQGQPTPPCRGGRWGRAKDTSLGFRRPPLYRLAPSGDWTSRLRYAQGEGPVKVETEADGVTLPYPCGLCPWTLRSQGLADWSPES